MGYTTVLGSCLLSLSMAVMVSAVTDHSNTVEKLARQMIMQQLFMEERIRSDGDSGIKHIRLTNHGTKNYHSETHSGDRNTATIHDHTNYIRTVGMGEVDVVLNGVDFRTRHNDYGLYQPSTTEDTYNAVEEIPFPEVPEAVTSLSNVSDQVVEMREWFRAWGDQNYTVRDYRDYFKPVLCYMEGAWTITDENIDEPFDSERHFLDAVSWQDLHDKLRFTSATGTKHNLENFAFLPTTIVDIVNDTIPVLAQWNYRILCHPLNRDLPLNRFRVVNEMATRMRYKWTMEQLSQTRAARYQLNPADTDEWEEGIMTYGLLDELMAEIPGKNNHGAVLYDDALGMETYEYTDMEERLNAAYYHRSYQAHESDAMGTNARHRTFSDENAFMAMTNHTEVAAATIDECADEVDPCLTEQRWSYAIPLEIIYLTPLNSWNPFNIEYKGHYKSDEGKTVNVDTRRGGDTNDTAFNGSNSKIYYRTPVEFFDGDDQTGGAADTGRSGVGVLNADGEFVTTTTSGISVFFPSISGIGILRQRYPIFPVHGEGSSVWKELEALKEVVLNPLSNRNMFTEDPGGEAVVVEESSSDNTTFELRPSAVAYGEHIHSLTITQIQLETLLGGGEVGPVTTNQAYSHTHSLTLSYDSMAGKFEYVKCDSNDRDERCWDKHPTTLKST